MPLTTRCSHCGRLFPVQAQQLRERRGKVDCPQCGRRFSAVDELLDEVVSGARASGEIVGTSTAPVTAPADMLDLDEGRAKIPRPRVLLWSMGVLFLSALLLLQLVWWDRGRWLQQPRVSAAVEAGCRHLGCRPEPPRVAGAFEVLGQALTPRTEPPGSLRLTLALTNRTKIVQRFPLLQLELYDHEGALTAARRFAPALYLAGSDHRFGLAAGAAAHPTLELAPLPVPAAAFRIRLF